MWMGAMGQNPANDKRSKQGAGEAGCGGMKLIFKVTTWYL